ncbi:MAG: class I tRNA ligase family protein, partial [Patescibacteria group bacterium]
MSKKQTQPKQSKNPFSAMEEEVLKFWDKNKIFEKSVERDAPKGDYVFYDGPPFGTGEPHYGHILSSVTKDVVPRYWTMQGYKIERRWGWDCHGLPIENIIEKDFNISGKKQIEELGIDKFNEAARSKVLQYANSWSNMVRRIGRWVEFENSYKTMDLSYMESVWWAFKELWKKKLVYEGRKVLLYCPRCETPISNFEVAMDNSYKDITEKSVTAKFKVKDKSLKANKILQSLSLPQNDKKSGVYILAWTTTPWTLPGNVALAVGNNIEYVIIKNRSNVSLRPSRYANKKEISRSFIDKGGAYILSWEVLWKNLHSNAGLTELRDLLVDIKNPDKLDSDVKRYISKPKEFIREYKLEIVKGKDLAGLEYEPLFDVPALKESGKKVYYVTDADFVTTEEGTGIVHTAVVYGEDDYNLGLKLDLPVVPALDEKGHFNETVPQLAGTYFLQANKKVIDYLEDKQLLFDARDYKHSYPHCHRCDTQLFYNAIPAWFLNVQKLKKRMLELNKNINWFPKYLKEGRFAQGIEQAPDWNISRNRYFATPIPIWKCNTCKELEIIGSVDDLKNKSGAKKIEDIHNHRIDNLTWQCKCGGEMKRIPEVFDCWVESGSMPFAQHHYPFENKEKFETTFPAQFISEYISQTRAWFYVMHVLSTALFDKNSFENVVANGVILNEKGEKLSKSKKNYPDPWEMINEFGVDALRMYLMSSPLMQAENLLFNERELRDIFRKNIMLLWNVYKFYEMYVDKVKVKSQKIESENMLDKWIIARLNQLIDEVTENMNNYNLVKATRPIEEFINDLSTWYIRRSRDRFKSEDEQDKQAALNTTGFVLLELSKVIAPVMPFMAETIWQKVTGNDFKDGNKSAHLESFPTVEKIDDKIIGDMAQVQKIVEMGLAKRDEAGIKVRQPLSELRITNYELRNEYENLIKDELNVKSVK